MIEYFALLCPSGFVFLHVMKDTFRDHSRDASGVGMDRVTMVGHYDPSSASSLLCCIHTLAKGRYSKS